MTIIALLFLLGVFLSGFFSGSETGFYRASRVRFVMDGIDGDRISKYMLMLFNNPTLFVATTLVGNNIANYLVSLAIVLATKSIFPMESSLVEILAPIALAPALFVYGESLPKSLFFMAPNQLLRFSAPLILVFTLVLAPVAAVLWSLARLLENFLGESPEKIRLHLARRELQDVLQEGQEAGILHPSQRLLGQNFFLVAAKPVSDVCTPIARVDALPAGTCNEDIIRFATRKKLPEVFIHELGKPKTCIVGYLRTIDLIIDQTSAQTELQKLVTIDRKEFFGEALLRMQAARETVALVVAEDGQPVGVLSINQLTDPLLKGPLGSLRR